MRDVPKPVLAERAPGSVPVPRWPRRFWCLRRAADTAQLTPNTPQRRSRSQFYFPSGTTVIAVSYAIPPWRKTEDVVSVICIANLLPSVFEQIGDQRLILCAGPLDTWQSSHQHLSLSYLRSSKFYLESVPTVTALRKLSDARTWVSALTSLPFLLIPSQKSQRSL